MNCVKEINQKEKRIILSAFLLISLPIIIDIGVIFAKIALELSDTNIIEIYNVVRYITMAMAPFAYFLLSFATNNKAVRNILRIVAVIELLNNIDEIYFTNYKELYSLNNTMFLIKSLTQSILYLINILALCYLWGAVRRNYNLNKKSISRINSYIITVFVILPCITQTIGLFLFSQNKLAYYIILALAGIIEIALLYLVITPNIFCSESTNITTKEQYRFWNKYHLWWFIGFIGTCIGSSIVGKLLF